jgi:hypothetical protein
MDWSRPELSLPHPPTTHAPASHRWERTGAVVHLLLPHPLSADHSLPTHDLHHHSYNNDHLPSTRCPVADAICISHVLPVSAWPDPGVGWSVPSSLQTAALLHYPCYHNDEHHYPHPGWLHPSSLRIWSVSFAPHCVSSFSCTPHLPHHLLASLSYPPLHQTPSPHFPSLLSICIPPPFPLSPPESEPEPESVSVSDHSVLRLSHLLSSSCCTALPHSCRTSSSRSNRSSRPHSPPT